MFHDRRRILINQGAIMTIETTSTSASWSPQGVLNNGNALIWEVSGGVTIPPQTINDPTFDLSTNTGNAIITVKDVSDLYILDIHDLSITSLNFSSSTSLILLSCYNNQISELDISKQLDLGTVSAQNNQLTTLDLINNINVYQLDVATNPLTSTSKDDVVITLDAHELSDGTLRLPTGRTSASDTAYYNLETVKNWIITES